MGILKKTVNVPASEAIFSDISMDIKIELRDTVQDIDSITQKILFIIGTRKGSRRWRERFGSNVQTYLFEPFDDETAGWIQTEIRTALMDVDNGLSETISEVDCKVYRSVNQTYECSVSWRVPALEQKEKTTINFAMRPL